MARATESFPCDASSVARARHAVVELPGARRVHRARLRHRGTARLGAGDERRPPREDAVHRGHASRRGHTRGGRQRRRSASPRLRAPDADGGRGLRIVDALAEEWGSRARAPGKVRLLPHLLLSTSRVTARWRSVRLRYRGAMDASPLSGARILVTGPTGQVALPVTLALAADNEVIGIARFRDADARGRLEAAGVTCIETNLAAGDFDGVPADVDYVLNLAVVKSNRWDVDLAANAEATGLLMAHCRDATRVAALLVDGCLRTGRAAPAGRDRPARRQPPGDHGDVLDRQDRGRGRRAHRRPPVGPARPRSPASTSPTATTAAGPRSTWR